MTEWQENLFLSSFGLLLKFKKWESRQKINIHPTQYFCCQFVIPVGKLPSQLVKVKPDVLSFFALSYSHFSLCTNVNHWLMWRVTSFSWASMRECDIYHGRLSLLQMELWGAWYLQSSSHMAEWNNVNGNALREIRWLNCLCSIPSIVSRYASGTS